MRVRTLNRITKAAMSATALVLAAGCHPKAPPMTATKPFERTPAAATVTSSATEPSAFESDPEVISLRSAIKEVQSRIDAAAAKPVPATQPQAPLETQPGSTQPSETQPANPPEDPAESMATQRMLLDSFNGRLQSRLAKLQSDADAARAAAMPATVPATEPTSEPVTLPPASQPTTMPVTEPATMPAAEPVTKPAVTQPTTMPAAMPATMPGKTTGPTTTASTMPASTMPATTRPAVADEPLPTDPNVIEADEALADLIAGIASLSYRPDFPQSVMPSLYEHQAALLGAAATLVSTQPESPSWSRFSRLQAEAYRGAGDTDGEFSALSVATGVKRDDDTSWMRLLDLILSRDAYRDDAAARRDYLTQHVVANLDVPTDIRSYAQYLLAETLYERGEETEAASAMDESLRLNPSNFKCLQLKLAKLPADTSPFQRCSVLLDLLRANPMQPAVSLEAADILARAGLAQEATEFYKMTDDTLTMLGMPQLSIRTSLAAEWFMLDQTPYAQSIVKDVLGKDAQSPSAIFLQLVMDRTEHNNTQYAAAYQRAVIALTNRVIDASNKIGAVAQATTRPIDVGGPADLPDLAPSVAKLKATQDVALRQQFVEAVSDLALLKVYFGQTPDEAAPLIDTLTATLSPDAPEVARLRGWIALKAGKTDQAKAILTPIAGLDPIAAMGLAKAVSADPAQREMGEKLARKLMQDNPSGVIGAILKEGMETDRVKLLPGPDAGPLAELVGTFPRDWETLAVSPRNFYTVNFRPKFRAVAYGEPLLAELTIINTSSQPLTVGPDGVVKPVLLFRLSMAVASVPAMITGDRYAGPVVIPPKGSATQTVRLDSPQVLTTLNSISEMRVFEINGLAVTNTVHLVPGLASEQQQMAETFVRLTTEHVKKIVESTCDDIAIGRPADKIAAISRAREFYLEDLNVKNPSAAVLAEVTTLHDTIHRARADAIPAVAAWASWCEGTILDSAGAENLARDMAESGDWRHRELALALLPKISPAVRTELLNELKDDTQAVVRADAEAQATLLAQLVKASRQSGSGPTTGPTSGPTSGPSMAPATGPSTSPAVVPSTMP